MAGRAPPFSLNPNDPQKRNHYRDLTRSNSPASDDESDSDPSLPTLHTPTLHVHGLQDGGLDQHRELLDRYTSPGQTRLIEWDGAHRIPIKSTDVRRVTEGIYDVAGAPEVTDEYASEDEGMNTMRDLIEASS